MTSQCALINIRRNRTTTIAIIMALAWATAALAAEGVPPMRMYSQDVQITYATAEDAAKAEVELAPVYDNRDWAFSARWDDNNANSLNMRDHMAKYGLKGTFYLNATDNNNRYGEEYAQKLLVDGFSVGGHSQTHPKLPELAPNAIFYEVLANRVEREAQTNQPINSLAFPFGQYKSGDPVALEATTRSLRRAGFHHSVYLDFVKNNPYLAEGEFSSVIQVVPGDRQVDAEKFRQNFDKPFKWRDAYVKSSYCISLGVHPWQQGEEWNKLDALFEELSGRDDFWYCNMTEWASYYRQRQFSTLEAQPADEGATSRAYSLQRPEPGETGDDAPLTWVIRDADVTSVQVGGQAVEFEKRGDAVVVNVPHSAGKALPAKIGRIDCSPAAAELTDEQQCADFPGVRMLLTPDRENGKLTLTCRTDAELKDVLVRFRLPLMYEEGVIARELADIAAGSTEAVELPLPKAREEEVWTKGSQYYVAEVDFASEAGPGRIFVTVRTD